ncbi:DUF4157 domain-containing protein [Streptomyces capparidis]
MRQHESEHEESAAAAKGRAPTEAPDLPHLLRAAAAGRSDVLGRSGAMALQRVAGNSAVGSVVAARTAEPGAPEERLPEESTQDAHRSPVHDVIGSGSGAPLDARTRGEMEQRLGADFSDVRVHTGAAAHESARSVGAHAYTVGNNVVFQRDAYDPSSRDGRITLAHELTHVIQQRSGPVEGTEAAGGIRVSDPSDRFEREAAANAERVMAEPSAPATAVTAATAAPPVQRQAEAEGEDETPADVQGLFVQRAQDEEEEPGQEP